MKKILFPCFIILYQFCFAQKFDVQTIFKSGSNDSRINLVILPDGYQSNELDKFITDATSISDALFAETPYKEYKNYFNVHAIKVPSKESGASHPGTATDVTEPAHPVSKVDNFFKSTFDSFGIHRLLVSNEFIANNVLAANFPAYDLAIILVNSPFYGGSGGAIAVSSVHANAKQIAIHELGHSFVNLIDEYYAGDTYSREGINMTAETNPNTVKWSKWMNQKGIGIYQHCCGGNSSKWYRPHQSCKMRYLASPFCAVCTEGTVRKIHSLTKSIDSYSPQNTTKVDLSTTTTFSINTISPIPNTLSVKWSLNGKVINDKDSSVSISQSDLISGNNQLRVTVEDTTSFLKVNNSENIHITTLLWEINLATLSIDNVVLENLQIKLFPNPTQEVLYIDMLKNNTQNYDITIADISGKKLITKSFNALEQQPKIQLSSLNAGVYFVSFKFENGLVVSRKIIKK